jgi:hypothetical protein
MEVEASQVGDGGYSREGFRSSSFKGKWRKRYKKLALDLVR